jgi:hypothetical protein
MHQGATNALSSWQAIQSNSPGLMPQMSTTSQSQNTVTIKIASREEYPQAGLDTFYANWQ